MSDYSLLKKYNSSFNKLYKKKKSWLKPKPQKGGVVEYIKLNIKLSDTNDEDNMVGGDYVKLKALEDGDIMDGGGLCDEEPDDPKCKNLPPSFA